MNLNGFMLILNVYYSWTLTSVANFLIRVSLVELIGKLNRLHHVLSGKYSINVILKNVRDSIEVLDFEEETHPIFVCSQSFSNSKKLFNISKSSHTSRDYDWCGNVGARYRVTGSLTRPYLSSSIIPLWRKKYYLTFSLICCISILFTTVWLVGLQLI